MQVELQLEEGSRATKRGTNGPFASVLRSRWSHAILLAATTAALIATAVHYYRTIDRELTEVALSRRATVAQLAAATLSEKFARLVDLAVSLATRVRFRELVAAGRDIAGSYQFGANSYVVKPVEFEQFSETMVRAGRDWMLMNKTP